MNTVKPMTVTRAKSICDNAVSKVTRTLDATDHTAPRMWQNARRVEAADDRQWYRNNRTMARTAAEREGNIVLTMLDDARKGYIGIGYLYGLRDAHRDAIIIGVRHASVLEGLGIDTAELRAAVEFLGEARRK